MEGNNYIKETRKKFISGIVCIEAMEKQSLLKLQSDYENNKILEEDLTQEQVRRLKELYKEQIDSFKNKIELNKRNAYKLREELLRRSVGEA